jgi:RNA polymerase sigma factor (sigma-70 family)
MDKQRYVLLDGEKIYVSEDVYRAYYRPVWREAKQSETRKDRECSLNALEADGFEAVSACRLIDEIVADKLLLDELYAALDELTSDERSLIDALYFDEKSERTVATNTGCSKTSIHKQKTRILEKLRKLLK